MTRRCNATRYRSGMRVCDRAGLASLRNRHVVLTYRHVGCYCSCPLPRTPQAPTFYRDFYDVNHVRFPNPSRPFLFCVGVKLLYVQYLQECS